MKGSSTSTTGKDALVHAIGQRIIADPGVNAAPWDAYALIAWYGEGHCILSGFRYLDAGDAAAATPDDGVGLQALFQQLRQATAKPGLAPWDACVVQIVKATGKISIDFEYEDAERWRIRPGTLTQIMARARPATG